MSKTKPRNYDQVPDIDFARLATWIDTEGCLLIIPSGKARKNTYHAARINVVQSCEAPMRWLKDTFGGNYHKGGGGTNSQMWYWHVNGADIDEILARCMPFFLVKGRQAQLILEYRRTLGKGRTPLTVETILQREIIRKELRFVKCPWERPIQEVAEPAPVTDTVH